MCFVMLCALRYDLRAPLLALCLTSHFMLCIAPFLSLRPKKRPVRRASHIASRHVPCFFTLIVLAKLLCHAFTPQLAYKFPPIRCVGNSVLGIAFKCRPIDYHPMFPNIRLIYSNQETTN